MNGDSTIVPVDLQIVVWGIFSFGIGSVPFGYLISRIFKGIDIRNFGSGNIGATNVGRVIGWKYGLWVLFLDTLKGVMPVLFGKLYLGETISSINTTHLCLYLGFLSILGHVFTPFMNFRGGKGVATSLGVFLVLIPFSTLSCVLVFWIAYRLSGYISVGSLVASFVLPFFYYFYYRIGINPDYSLVLQTSLVGIFAFLVFLHRDNLLRLYQGKEWKPVLEKGVREDADIAKEIHNGN